MEKVTQADDFLHQRIVIFCINKSIAICWLSVSATCHAHYCRPILGFPGRSQLFSFGSNALTLSPSVAFSWIWWFNHLLSRMCHHKSFKLAQLMALEMGVAPVGYPNRKELKHSYPEKLEKSISTNFCPICDNRHGDLSAL
jgi:hypothetical protein